MGAAKPSLETLGQLIVEKRGRTGVRAAAREIGISPATLSRVENGHLPDLENFRLICKWLDVEPNRILGFSSSKRPGARGIRASVHFRKQKTSSPETAAALANLILHVQRALAAQAEP
jgi:transcriptional regulator with XRE-family HTH domain